MAPLPAGTAGPCQADRKMFFEWKFSAASGIQLLQGIRHDFSSLEHTRYHSFSKSFILTELHPY